MPTLPPVAYAAWLRHCASRVHAATHVRWTAESWLDVAWRRGGLPLGVIDRTTRTFLLRLRRGSENASDDVGDDAGEDAPGESLRVLSDPAWLAGSVVTTMRPMSTCGVASIASLPIEAARDPRGHAIRATASGWTARIGTMNASLVVCSDPFDTAMAWVLGIPAIAWVNDGRADDPTALRAFVSRHGVRRLLVATAGTSLGDSTAARWVNLGGEMKLDVERRDIARGLTIRDLWHLEGEDAVRAWLSGQSRHRVRGDAAIASAGSQPIRVRWSGNTALAASLNDYLRHLRGLGRARPDCQRSANALAELFDCAARLGVDDLRALDRSILEGFQSALVSVNELKGKQRTRGATSRILASTRAFLAWAHQTGRMERALAGVLQPLTRPPSLLPMVLTVEEVERVLAATRWRERSGLRDRAMLELFYSTGMRRAELCGLDCDDIDVAAGVVRIRLAKGRRTRIVPLGRRAASWIVRYLETVRVRHLKHGDEKALFLTRRGRRIGVKAVTTRMHDCLRRAGVAKAGSCHILRHSVATILHDGGADIRDLQALLGHALLTSTQLYTRVSLQRLHQVMRFAHPAERGDGVGMAPESFG
jgi:integrase/recombinase XerD